MLWNMKKIEKIFFIFFKGGWVWGATLSIWTLTHPTSAGVGISNHKKVHILWHQYQSCGTGNMSQLHHPCHKATTFGTYATTLLRLVIVLKLNN